MQWILSQLPYIQVALAVIMSVAILMQQSSAGLGGAFGGGDNWSAAYHTRRGLEKFLFNGTIVLAVLFAATSLIAITVSK
jgi:preprotein translocase subunit SecG